MPDATRTKLNLRLPQELREAVQTQADRLGVSLNALCVMAIRSHVAFLARAPVGAGVRQAAAGAQVPEPSTTRATPTAAVPRVGANDLCPCGSGTKYKRCHGRPG
jgi:uncharacterized protein YecA (UPF0149 family)